MKKFCLAALLLAGCARDKGLEPQAGDPAPLLGTWFSAYHAPSLTFTENEYAADGEFRARHHRHALDSATGRVVLDTVEPSPFRYTYKIDRGFIFRSYHPDPAKDSVRGVLVEKFVRRGDSLSVIWGDVVYGNHPTLEGRWEDVNENFQVDGGHFTHVISFVDGMFSDSTYHPTRPAFGTVPRPYQVLEDTLVIMASSVLPRNDTLEISLRDGGLYFFNRSLRQWYTRVKPALP